MQESGCGQIEEETKKMKATKKKEKAAQMRRGKTWSNCQTAKGKFGKPRKKSQGAEMLGAKLEKQVKRINIGLKSNCYSHPSPRGPIKAQAQFDFVTRHIQMYSPINS